MGDVRYSHLMRDTEEDSSQGLPGLRKIREENGLDRYDLADLVGVRYPTIHRLETDAANCSVGLLKRLTRALKCSSDRLLGITAAN